MVIFENYGNSPYSIFIFPFSVMMYCRCPSWHVSDNLYHFFIPLWYSAAS